MQLTLIIIFPVMQARLSLSVPVFKIRRNLYIDALEQ